jgi:hypothetical protein
MESPAPNMLNVYDKRLVPRFNVREKVSWIIRREESACCRVDRLGTVRDDVVIIFWDIYASLYAIPPIPMDRKRSDVSLCTL